MPTTAASLQVVVGGDVRGALTGLNQVNKAVSQTGGFLRGAASTALGFAGAALGLNLAGGAAGAFKTTAIDMNDALEQNAIAFTTLLGSAEKAGAFLSGLEQFAATTPFEFAGLAKSSQQMLAVGFSANQILPLLTDVGNAAAAMGSGTSGVESITRAILQMKGIGVVQMGELNQLSEQGINGLDLLAKHMGKTTAQTRKMVERGEISADTFVAAFQQFSSSRFGGMMEKQALTFGGAMSTIFDTVKMGAARVFKPFFELIREGAVNLSKWLQGAEFAAWVERARQGVADLVQGWGTFAVMAGNIAKVQGQGPLDAIMTTAELWLRERFGERTAAGLHAIWDAFKVAAGLAATWLPRFFAWLAKEGPPTIEAVAKLLGDFFSWLGTQANPEGLTATDWLTTWKNRFVTTVTDVKSAVEKAIADIEKRITDMIVMLGTLPIPLNPLAEAARTILSKREGARAAEVAAAGAIPFTPVPVEVPPDVFLPGAGAGGPDITVTINNPVVATPEDVGTLEDQVTAVFADLLNTSQQGGRALPPPSLVGAS